MRFSTRMVRISFQNYFSMIKDQKAEEIENWIEEDPFLPE